MNGRQVTREKRHGYVFEVPANEEGLVEPVPLRAMGRFEHEACAVHEPTGIIYMTEDRHYSLFYRYIPDVPGKLREGGRLQALASPRAGGAADAQLVERPDDRGWPLTYDVDWIDLRNMPIRTRTICACAAQLQALQRSRAARVSARPGTRSLSHARSAAPSAARTGLHLHAQP